MSSSKKLSSHEDQSSATFELEAVFIDGFELHIPSRDEISFLLTDPDFKNRT